MVNLSVSIITVCYNSIETISDTIKSVLSQTFHNVEFIIIDGTSTDGTVELIKSFGQKISIVISEPDKGIYDAINKGIRLSSGDIIGILNSDDFFYDNRVVERLVCIFQENKVDAVYGDVQVVDKKNVSKKIRYYSSKTFNIAKFKFGFMPAHPSFYAKRELFEKYGYYKTDYKIAADFELLVRFLYINKIKARYLNMVFVSMRTGGVSNKTILNRFVLNREIMRACKENGIKTNYLNIYSKYFIKLFEFFGIRENKTLNSKS